MRVVDVHEAEVQAEKQLTRRYWKFIDGASCAISLVMAGTLEAATLAVRL